MMHLLTYLFEWLLPAFALMALATLGCGMILNLIDAAISPQRREPRRSQWRPAASNRAMLI